MFKGSKGKRTAIYVHYTNKHTGKENIIGFKREKEAEEFAKMVEGKVFKTE